MASKRGIRRRQKKGKLVARIVNLENRVNEISGAHSTQEHKRTKASEQPITRQEELQPNRQRGGTKIKLLGKVAMWMLTSLSLLSILSLIPRLSVTPSSSPNYSNRVRFTISNDGPLRTSDVRAGCFLWRVQFGNGDVDADYLSPWYLEPEELRSPDGWTIDCSLPGSNLVSIDLAIVVYYRPWPFTFLRFHKLFRFVGRPTSDLKGTIYDRQPSAPLENDFNELLKSTPAPPL
jgi:hypothetical protein